MNPVAKLLVVVGILLVLAGLWWQFGSRFLPLGRLPGDIAIEGKHVRFYFPITSSILVSLLLTFILYIISLIRR